MTPQYGNFSFPWHIGWDQFNEMSTKKITKFVEPAHENVVFRWKLEIGAAMEGNDEDKFGFSVSYDGPKSELDDVIVIVDLGNKHKYHNLQQVGPYKAKRGNFKNSPNFDFKDIALFKTRHKLEDSRTIFFHVTIKIPLSAFSYRMENNSLEPRPNWFTTFYENIEDAEKSEYADVQFVSADGDIFFCHRIMMAIPSSGLPNMFRNPKTENEQKGIWNFRTLSGETLRAILKFLYTGKAELAELASEFLMQVADFGEQYILKDLKEKASAVLWQRVVENPEDAIEILRFADLHDDLQYLKDRALDVVLENFEKLSLKMEDFSKGNDADLQGGGLRDDFAVHALRRLYIWYERQ